jgi:L-rhamnose-H+ transport protein
MDIAAALLLVVLSGAMAGTALTPIKLMRGYTFGNYWLIHSLVGTVILPWMLAFAAVPDLMRLYERTPVGTLIVPPLFAFSWGLASTLGGLSVSRIGLSLAYALVIGLGASAGTLVPLAVFSPTAFQTAGGLVILSGVGVMFLGLAIVTLAGNAREKAAAGARVAAVPRSVFVSGLVMAGVAGILSSGLNFSFAFSGDLISAAQAAGASPAMATYPVWSLAMLGGMLPNLGYAFWRCWRDRAWPQFQRTAKPDLGLSALMGMLFMGSVAFYGLGAVKLGPLGTSVGWGIMQIMQIAVGNLGGWATGEWKTAPSHAVRRLFLGLALLFAACALMAWGNHLHEEGN